MPKGSFAALRTDMSKDWDNPEKFKRSPFPAWSLETIKFLVEQRGVTAIGHESLDTDITDKMESETYVLQKGRYQIEVMANLDQVPANGALIVVTWPKVKDGLGFPARAFAILPLTNAVRALRGPTHRQYKKWPGQSPAVFACVLEMPPYAAAF